MAETNNKKATSPKCGCGHLLDMSICIEERFKVQDDDLIFLQMSDADWVPITFCPYCGGKNIADAFNELQSESNKCSCKLFHDFLNVKNSKVEFFNNIQAYFIKTDTGEHIPCNFCISCGRYVSQLYDRDKIVPPNLSEIIETITQLSSRKTIASFIQHLGEPDFIQTPDMFNFNSHTPKMWQKIKTKLIYSSNFQSFDLHITEYFNSKIGMLFYFRPFPAQGIPNS